MDLADFFKNACIFAKVGDFELVPVRVELRSNGLLISAVTTAGEFGGTTAMDLIESLKNQLDAMGFKNYKSWTRPDGKGKERVDSILILFGQEKNACDKLC